MIDNLLLLEEKFSDQLKAEITDVPVLGYFDLASLSEDNILSPAIYLIPGIPGVEDQLEGNREIPGVVMLTQQISVVVVVRSISRPAEARQEAGSLLYRALKALLAKKLGDGFSRVRLEDPGEIITSENFSYFPLQFSSKFTIKQ